MPRSCLIYDMCAVFVIVGMDTYMILFIACVSLKLNVFVLCVHGSLTVLNVLSELYKGNITGRVPKVKRLRVPWTTTLSPERKLAIFLSIASKALFVPPAPPHFRCWWFPSSSAKKILISKSFFYFILSIFIFIFAHRPHIFLFATPGLHISSFPT